MTEEWKDIPGYEGLYQASNLGRVKSLDRIVVYKDGRMRTYKGRILSPGAVRGGYQAVLLSKNASYESKAVHRLVAEAFIPNPEKLPEINHRDRDVTNNNVTNLEWCTRLYNANHDGAVERRIKQMRRKIQQRTMDDFVIQEYASVREASNKTGVSSGNISRAARGIYSHAGGYKWTYI